MSIWVHVRACACMCMYVCSASVRGGMRVRTSLGLQCVYVCVHACIGVCVCVYVSMCVYVFAYAHPDFKGGSDNPALRIRNPHRVQGSVNYLSTSISLPLGPSDTKSTLCPRIGNGREKHQSRACVRWLPHIDTHMHTDTRTHAHKHTHAP